MPTTTFDHRSRSAKNLRSDKGKRGHCRHASRLRLQLWSHPRIISTGGKQPAQYLYDEGSVRYWPSRDPIGERGGINLYGMVGNDAVGKWDYLGMKLDRVDTNSRGPGAKPPGANRPANAPPRNPGFDPQNVQMDTHRYDYDGDYAYYNCERDWFGEYNGGLSAYGGSFGVYACGKSRLCPKCEIRGVLGLKCLRDKSLPSSGNMPDIFRFNYRFRICVDDCSDPYSSDDLRSFSGFTIAIAFPDRNTFSILGNRGELWNDGDFTTAPTEETAEGSNAPEGDFEVPDIDLEIDKLDLENGGF